MKKDQKSISNLFVEELQDILNAEIQIVDSLPDLINAAQATDLKEAFTNHLEETKGQIKRLQKIFTLLKIEPEATVICKAMKGLIQECKHVIKEYGLSAVRDAALISKVQRIEHYEISAYGTISTFAKELDFSEAVTLLKENEAEEANADKKLTKIAEGSLLTSGINHKAHL